MRDIDDSLAPLARARGAGGGGHEAVSPLPGQYGGHAEPLDVRHGLIEDEPVQPATEVADGERWPLEGDGEVTAARHARRRRLVIEHLVGPAAARQPRVRRQRGGIDRHQVVVQAIGSGPGLRPVRWPGCDGRQPEPGGDDVLADNHTRAGADSFAGACHTDPHAPVPDCDLDALLRLGGDPDLKRLKILPGSP